MVYFIKKSFLKTKRAALGTIYFDKKIFLTHPKKTIKTNFNFKPQKDFCLNVLLMIWPPIFFSTKGVSARQVIGKQINVIQWVHCLAQQWPGFLGKVSFSADSRRIFTRNAIISPQSEMLFLLYGSMGDFHNQTYSRNHWGTYASISGNMWKIAIMISFYLLLKRWQCSH